MCYWVFILINLVIYCFTGDLILVTSTGLDSDCAAYVVDVVIYCFTGDLLPMTSTGLEQYTATSSSSMRQDKDIFLIYIHALQNGLFRIHMEGNTGK